MRFDGTGLQPLVRGGRSVPGASPHRCPVRRASAPGRSALPNASPPVRMRAGVEPRPYKVLVGTLDPCGRATQRSTSLRLAPDARRVASRPCLRQPTCRGGVPSPPVVRLGGDALSGGERPGLGPRLPGRGGGSAPVGWGVGPPPLGQWPRAPPPPTRPGVKPPRCPPAYSYRSA